MRQFYSELQLVVLNIFNIMQTPLLQVILIQTFPRLMNGPNSKKYFDLFTTHGLFPSITLPTRSYNMLIDQMYCKLKDPKQFVFSCVIDTMLSDHYTCFSIVDILKS